MADADPIRAAIEQLRADLDGLPDWLRVQWDVGEVESTAIVGPHRGVLFRPPSGHLTTRQIANASPHVTEALWKHLEALCAWSAVATSESPIEDYRAAVDDLRSTARALATAITRRPE